LFTHYFMYYLKKNRSHHSSRAQKRRDTQKGKIILCAKASFLLN